MNDGRPDERRLRLRPVRYTATVEHDEAYLCHCRMCQRADRLSLDRLQERKGR